MGVHSLNPIIDEIAAVKSKLFLCVLSYGFVIAENADAH